MSDAVISGTVAGVLSLVGAPVGVLLGWWLSRRQQRAADTKQERAQLLAQMQLLLTAVYELNHFRVDHPGATVFVKPDTRDTLRRLETSVAAAGFQLRVAENRAIATAAEQVMAAALGGRAADLSDALDALWAAFYPDAEVVDDQVRPHS